MSPQQENKKIPTFVRAIKLLICGGRKYNDKEFMFKWLDEFAAVNTVSHVIHGDCGGADRLANEWAEERCIQPVKLPALWKQLGNAAGPIRNRAMALLTPDLVIAFPGGNGTRSMTSIARANGIKVLEISPLFPHVEPVTPTLKVV